jgi:hypothetical protein
MSKGFKRWRLSAATSWFVLLLPVVLLVALPRGQAQTATRRTPVHGGTRAKATPPANSQQPRLKGIFEPVNYNQDLDLYDAFFLTPEKGWVSGAAGTILHTVDGGKTWTAQLGGDPQSQGPQIARLFFLDGTHGWAQTWQSSLLRTSDGENWQQVNDNVRGQNVVFITPLRGFYAYSDKIYATENGGTNWREVFTCATQAMVQGLTKQIRCGINALQFASPRIGYGVGENSELGGGVVVKTEDGGASWNVVFIPQEAGDQRTNVVFFLDDNRGFAFRNTGMYRTIDGGKTWQGVPASIAYSAEPLKFADPEVGWGLAQLPANSNTARLTYTADGGAHWLARDFDVPALVRGFSLPRRDTGYIVGEHGMVYRYRVVPADYTVAHMIPAPLMPGFDSPVLKEVATMRDVVAQLQAKLPARVAPPSGTQTFAQPGAQNLPPSGGANPASAALPGGTQTFVQPGGQSSGQAGGQSSAFQQATTASGSGAAGGVFQQDSSTGPVPGGYMDSCCGALMQQLETTAGTFATDIPTFSSRFRNLNLIFEGLNFLNSIVNQANTLKQSIHALRHAKDAQSAAVALSTVQTQVNGISSSGGFVQDTSFPGR